MRPSTCARSVRSRRCAFSSVYVVLLLLPLIGFASLAVDMGRVRLARANLQAGADASARAGVSGLPVGTSTAQSRAVTFAADNTCLNAPIAVSAATDVELGTWDPAKRKFTAIVSTGKANDPIRTANAVHVTAYRTASRNGAVRLAVAAIIGKPTADVSTDAVAYITGGPTRFGIVALDSFSAKGNNVTIDSYNAATETYPGVGGFNSNASLASNGGIDMGNGDVYGDVRAGIGQSISQGPNSEITGWRNDLDQTLVYPPATVPANAVPLPSASPIPAGTYKTANLSGNLTFSGAVTIYVTGNVDLKGNTKVLTSGNLPANLEIDVVGSGSVDLGGKSMMYAHVYAPQSDIIMHGTPGFFGWLVGKTVTLKGTSDIHYDESIQNMTPYKISLVK